MSENKYYQYYKDRCNEKYYNHVKNKYGFLIDAINESARIQSVLMPMYSIELGCGLSNISKALMEKTNTPFTCFNLLDNSIDMLKLSCENLGLTLRKEHEGEYTILNPHILKDQISLHVRDVLNLSVEETILKQTVTHSHGLLEHFNTEQIVHILDTFKGSKHFHYVPGEKYKTPSIGDERLLSVNAWRDITGMNVEVFNNGYDYLITNT